MHLFPLGPSSHDIPPCTTTILAAPLRVPLHYESACVSLAPPICIPLRPTCTDCPLQFWASGQSIISSPLSSFLHTPAPSGLRHVPQISRCGLGCPTISFLKIVEVVPVNSWYRLRRLLPRNGSSTSPVSYLGLVPKFPPFALPARPSLQPFYASAPSPGSHLDTFASSRPFQHPSIAIRRAESCTSNTFFHTTKQLNIPPLFSHRPLKAQCKLLVYQM